MSDGTRTGNWPYLYGVGVEGELHQFDAAAQGFRQEYQGLRAIAGTSTTVAVSPQFGAPAHVTSGPTAGTGGGVYTISAGSPAKNRLSRCVLAYDLGGAIRPASGVSAGAYQ